MPYNNLDDRKVDYHTKLSKTSRDLLHMISEDFHISECMIIEQMIFHTAKNMKGNPVLSKLANAEERLSNMRIYERINYIISKEAFIIVDFEKELVAMKKSNVDDDYIKQIMRNTLVKVNVSSLDKDKAIKNVEFCVKKYFPKLKKYVLELALKDLSEIDDFTPLPGWERKEWVKLSGDDRKMKRMEYKLIKEKEIIRKADQMLKETEMNVKNEVIQNANPKTENT